MGSKYMLTATNSGLCPFSAAAKQTNSFIVAIFYLLRLKRKYPIVDFCVRNGHIDCEGCSDQACPRAKVVER